MYEIFKRISISELLLICIAKYSVFISLLKFFLEELKWFLNDLFWRKQPLILSVLNFFRFSSCGLTVVYHLERLSNNEIKKISYPAKKICNILSRTEYSFWIYLDCKIIIWKRIAQQLPYSCHYKPRLLVKIRFFLSSMLPHKNLIKSVVSLIS